MHDYDRRAVSAAGAETTSEISWYGIEHERIANLALKDHDAKVDQLNPSKPLDNHSIEISGTTTDGRTFRCVVSFEVRHVREVVSVTRTTVEGSVDMGPLPAPLQRVEQAVEAFLSAMSASTTSTTGLSDFQRLYQNNVLAEIEKWRQATPVDKQRLRSSLRSAVDRIDYVRSKLPDEQRATIAPGTTQPLHKVLDAARKALGAAARDVK